MRLKRNLALGILSIIIVFSTMVAYAAERSRETYALGGKATLSAYAYIDESGWGRHIGNAEGSLYGEDKYAAGNYRVEGYYGDYNPETYPDLKGYIGLDNGKYAVSLVKTGRFTSVYTDVYKQGTLQLLVGTSIDY